MSEIFETYVDVHEKYQFLKIPQVSDSESAKTITFGQWYGIPYKVILKKNIEYLNHAHS